VFRAHRSKGLICGLTAAGTNFEWPVKEKRIHGIEAVGYGRRSVYGPLHRVPSSGKRDSPFAFERYRSVPAFIISWINRVYHNAAIHREAA